MLGKIFADWEQGFNETSCREHFFALIALGAMRLQVCQQGLPQAQPYLRVALSPLIPLMVWFSLVGGFLLLDQKISEVHKDVSHQHGLFIRGNHQN
jgi:hypothetical protein